MLSDDDPRFHASGALKERDAMFEGIEQGVWVGACAEAAAKQVSDVARATPHCSRQVCRRAVYQHEARANGSLARALVLSQVCHAWLFSGYDPANAGSTDK